MPNGKSQYAQAVYLAQLQACKGSCKCKACELLRKAADAMTEETLNPQADESSTIKDALEAVRGAGYDIAGGPGEEDEP